MRIIKFITAHIIFVFISIIILAAVIYGTWLFSLKTWKGGLIFFVIVGLPLLIWLGFRYHKWRSEFKTNDSIIKQSQTSKSFIDNSLLMYESGRGSNEVNHEIVWDSLPEPGDTTQMGKTPKQIASETGLEAQQVSQSLQVLKARKKARSFKGKWRQSNSP